MARGGNNRPRGPPKGPSKEDARDGRRDGNVQRLIQHKREVQKDRQKKKMSGPHGEILRLWEDLRRVNAGIDVGAPRQGVRAGASGDKAGLAGGSATAIPHRRQKFSIIDRILIIITGLPDPVAGMAPLATRASTLPPPLKGAAISQAAIKHDVSRVLQSCAKHGSPAHRRVILHGLSAHLIYLSKNSFASPLIAALARHGGPGIALDIARLLLPALPTMLPHKIAVSTADACLKAIPPWAQRCMDAAALGQEIAGLAIGAFDRARRAARLAADDAAGTAVGTVAGEEDEDAEDTRAGAAAGAAAGALAVRFGPHQALSDLSLRKKTMQRLAGEIDKAAAKGALDSELVQRAMEAFLRYGRLGDITEVAADISGKVIAVMNTRPGALLALHCVNLGGDEGRAALLRSFRKSFTQILENEASVLVACRLVDVIPLEKEGAEAAAESSDDEEGDADDAEEKKKKKRASGKRVGIRWMVAHLLRPEILGNLPLVRKVFLESAVGSKFLLHLLARQPHRKQRYFSPSHAALLWSEGPTGETFNAVGGVLDSKGEELVEIQVCPSAPLPSAKHEVLLDAILPAVKAAILADCEDVSSGKLALSAEELVVPAGALGVHAPKGGQTIQRQPAAAKRRAERGEDATGDSTVNVPLTLARTFTGKRVMSEMLWQARGAAPHAALKDDAFTNLLARAMAVDVRRDALTELKYKDRHQVELRVFKKTAPAKRARDEGAPTAAPAAAAPAAAADAPVTRRRRTESGAVDAPSATAAADEAAAAAAAKAERKEQRKAEKKAEKVAAEKKADAPAAPTAPVVAAAAAPAPAAAAAPVAPAAPARAASAKLAKPASVKPAAAAPAAPAAVKPAKAPAAPSTPAAAKPRTASAPARDAVSASPARASASASAVGGTPRRTSTPTPAPRMTSKTMAAAAATAAKGGAAAAKPGAKKAAAKPGWH